MAAAVSRLTERRLTALQEAMNVAAQTPRLVARSNMMSIVFALSVLRTIGNI
jgi:hypothetical protein